MAYGLFFCSLSLSLSLSISCILVICFKDNIEKMFCVIFGTCSGEGVLKEDCYEGTSNRVSNVEVGSGWRCNDIMVEFAYCF